MNTPAHAVLNLALLSGRTRSVQPILAGAILPDLPILVLYLWERVVEGTPERVLWSETYFEPSWQAFIDVFNSIPLAGVALIASLALRRRGAALLFASAILHILMDLPLHHDDAHRHFFPFSDWRFESPVSYWDPMHHGRLGALFELASVAVASVVLWDRFDARAVRISLVLLNLLYAGGYSALLAFGP